MKLVKRYNIKIDGQLSPYSFTFEELKAMGIFKFDGIEVKELVESESKWQPIQIYFKDIIGQISIIPNNENGFYVDDYGQVIFRGKKNTNTENSKKNAITRPKESLWDRFCDSTNLFIILIKVIISTFLVIILVFTFLGGGGMNGASAASISGLSKIWGNS